MYLAPSAVDKRHDGVLSSVISRRQLRIHARANLPQWTDWLHSR